MEDPKVEGSLNPSIESKEMESKKLSPTTEESTEKKSKQLTESTPTIFESINGMAGAVDGENNQNENESEKSKSTEEKEEKIESLNRIDEFKELASNDGIEESSERMEWKRSLGRLKIEFLDPIHYDSFLEYLQKENGTIFFELWCKTELLKEEMEDVEFHKKMVEIYQSYLKEFVILKEFKTEGLIRLIDHNLTKLVCLHSLSQHEINMEKSILMMVNAECLEILDQFGSKFISQFSLVKKNI